MQGGTFPRVITMGDVIDSTLMHINDLPRPNSTLNGGKMLKHNYLHSVEHIIKPENECVKMPEIHGTALRLFR